MLRLKAGRAALKLPELHPVADDPFGALSRPPKRAATKAEIDYADHPHYDDAPDQHQVDLQHVPCPLTPPPQPLRPNRDYSGSFQTASGPQSRWRRWLGFAFLPSFYLEPCRGQQGNPLPFSIFKSPWLQQPILRWKDFLPTLHWGYHLFQSIPDLILATFRPQLD